MLLRKVRSAMSILNSSGWTGVGDALRRNLGVAAASPASAPDEVALVFEALLGDEATAGGRGVMVDVGAHEGSTAEPFWARGWQVLAFEPDAVNRQHLVQRAIGQQRVIVDPRAVADQPQEAASFFRSEQSSGISALSAFDASHRVADKVVVTTLAIALAEHGVTHIDFLKIDTEGYDKFVLQGLPWDRLQPRAIVCEFEDRKTVPLGYDFHSLAGSLVERSYSVIVSKWKPIVRYGIAHNWLRFQRYPCTLAEERAWGNLIAVHEPALLGRVQALCDRLSAAGAGTHRGHAASCTDRLS